MATKAQVTERARQKKEAALVLEAMRKARPEHAFLLRCEGVKTAEIGARLGICRGAAWQLLIKFASRTNRALRRTRWRIE